jgi:hypothetical protein
MRRPLIATITAILALAAASAATAEAVSVQPLRDAGYTVGIAFQPSEGCTVWAVSGHGVSTYVNDCDADAAATVASLADPTLIFERDWQMNHPEQLQAATTIGARCYSISRTAPATDQWRIVGGQTDVTVAGAELPGLAESLPDLHVDGACPTGVVVVTTPTTGSGGTVTVPGAPPVVAALAQAAAAAAPPPLPEPDPVDPTTYYVVEASPEVQAQSSIIGWVVTPYTTTPLEAAAE